MLDVLKEYCIRLGSIEVDRKKKILEMPNYQKQAKNGKTWVYVQISNCIIYLVYIIYPIRTG